MSKTITRNDLIEVIAKETGAAMVRYVNLVTE